MTKTEFELRSMPFDYIDLEEIGKTAAEVTGRKVKTVPQIYIGGNYIGGYDDFMAHINKTVIETEDNECRACEG